MGVTATGGWGGRGRGEGDTLSSADEDLPLSDKTKMSVSLSALKSPKAATTPYFDTPNTSYVTSGKDPWHVNMT